MTEINQQIEKGWKGANIHMRSLKCLQMCQLVGMHDIVFLPFLGWIFYFIFQTIFQLISINSNFFIM